MKNSTEADITQVVEKVKQNNLELLKSGRGFSYAVLHQIISSSNPLEGMIEELKRHHIFVTGVPPSLPPSLPKVGWVCI